MLHIMLSLEAITKLMMFMNNSILLQNSSNESWPVPKKPRNKTELLPSLLSGQF